MQPFLDEVPALDPVPVSMCNVGVTGASPG
jgi:hypothetical protein